MAYLTLTNLDLNETQRTSLDSYITSETTAGNTDSIKTTVTRTGVNNADNLAINLIQRSWKDSASANAFVSYCGNLGGTVVYSVVVAPL